MAINLTYDPSGDPQAIEADEARDAESYAIGDQLQQEQDALLAGKYRNAEDLERAYIELQRKFSSRSSDDDQGSDLMEDSPEGDDEQEVEPQEEVDYSFLNRLAEEADSGEFSPETLQSLEGMSATDIADMFLAYREQQPVQTEQREISYEEVSNMKGIVGGEEQYNQMVTWAAQNMSQEEIAVYDAVMDKGDPQAIYFAIQALNYRYQDSVGTEGRLLTGSAAQSMDSFRSQAEVVRAMSDPRYDNDPAYRQDVYEKLERSNVNF
jgi:hypothetical protein